MATSDVVDAPVVPFFPAMRTPYGVSASPGSKIAAYLRSTGAQSGDDITIGNNLVTTLSAALGRCRAGFGDTIVVLPGHAENVTTTPTFVAGTRIIGIELGTSTPTFTWTAASSQWAISVANVTISGLRLAVSGADGITKGINVTGSNCSILGNTFISASGAALKAAIMCEFGTGAANFKFNGNKVYGTATHNSDDIVHIAAAVSDWEVCGNRIIASSTAVTKGLVHVAAAALNGLIADNYLYNTHTGSTACIYFADVASDGHCCNNRMGAKVGTGVAPAVTGIVLAGTNTLWTFNENYSTPTKNTSGLVAPVVDA
jgi:hypothetical protein